MTEEEERVWVKDTEWVLLSAETTSKCRMIVGNPRRVCKEPAVAMFHRSNGWWAYCKDHLYGSRFANGRVEVSICRQEVADGR